MDGNGILETKMLIYIIVATLAGFISRWSLLKVDYRQYPSYPNGYLIHLLVGFIASASGAIAIPALISKNFTAVTFLLLAIQQFREVRKMERTSLEDLDKTEFYPRGNAYIDGISKSFESRNYLALIIAFTTVGTLLLIPQSLNIYIRIIIALIAAFIIHLIITSFVKGQSVKDIADVTEAKISFKGNNLYIDDIYVMNIGLEATKKRIMEKGIGAVLTPKSENDKIQLNSKAQQKAILHESARLLGLERYIESRRDFDTGRVAIIALPIRKEIKSLIHIIEHVPLLEVLKKQAHN